MLDVFNIAKPQNCDIQTFYGSQNSSAANQFAWIKPRGVSNIYMMLIGGGGNGDNSTAGGGSGAVTIWYGSAQNVPDDLIVSVSRGNGSNTIINYRASNGLNALLTANAGNSTTAAAAMTPNQFTASGFFQSIAGQAGGTTISASTTTFLSGGGNGAVSANYGYNANGGDGIFMLQPIIVGIGGGGSVSAIGGIGCGGGFSGKGGPGMVLIASW